MKHLNLRTHNLYTHITLALVIILSCCLYNVQAQMQGHYPVSAKGEFCTRSTPSELPHNPRYKMWCQKNFNNGSRLYEAYRQVAFNIKYTPEPPKTDLWQTPLETKQSQTGDCEDAIILFHDLMPHYGYKGEIIWGLVTDLQKKIRFAHVWFELFDKRGNTYIVEPFSGDWNGIIPVTILKEREIRHRIVGIPNDLISDIMRKPSEHERIKRSIVKQVIMFDWRLINQVDNVFANLSKVSQRYLQQNHE